MNRRWINVLSVVHKVSDFQVFQEKEEIAGAILIKNLCSAMNCFK